MPLLDSVNAVMQHYW